MLANLTVQSKNSVFLLVPVYNKLRGSGKAIPPADRQIAIKMTSH